MTVMQHEGESAQLRQVARLYANGDISRDDYRNIRTVMIDSFVADLDAVAEPARSTGAVTGGIGTRNTTVSLEVPMMAEAPRHVPQKQAPKESPMALLAILGAGAMLLIVAMLAMGLG